MGIIDCKKLSDTRRERLKKSVSTLGVRPGLAVIVVGNNPASLTYTRNKKKACEDVGFLIEVIHLSESVSTDDIVTEIKRFAMRNDVHGILVQLPLPAHIDTHRVIASIPPGKDVDALTTHNIGRLFLGIHDFAPCTPTGIMNVLEYVCGSVSGANCVVIGRSNIVGMPLAVMLTQANATVTLCHSKTEDISNITSRADILVSAVGKAGVVTADMIQQNAVVIDVGINRTNTGKLVGDVCFDEVLQKADAITPVPGGIGVMTVTSLLENTYKAVLLSADCEKKGYAL